MSQPGIRTPHLGTRAGVRLERLKPVGQWLLVALVLFFLGRVLARRWDELRTIEWQINLPLLVCSYLLLGAAWLALVANWRWLMLHMGASLRMGTAWRIWFLSNIVRYIPGNVWQFLGMVYLCEKEGISRTRTLASILVYQTASVASGLLAAGAVYLLAGQDMGRLGGESGSLQILSGRLPLWAGLGLVAGASLLSLTVCMPPVMNAFLRSLFRLLRRQPVQIELSVGDLARFFAQRLAIWALQGLGFALFVRSVYPASLGLFPVLAAAFVLSWVIGFVSLLTPSGLGVREASQTALLATVLPLPVSVALALTSRLWLIVGEIAGAGIGLILGRREQRRDRPAAQPTPPQEVSGDSVAH